LCKKKNENIIIFQKNNFFYFFLKNVIKLNKQQKRFLLLILKRFIYLANLVRYGFIVRLRFVGIGYRMEIDNQSSKIDLKLGYSENIVIDIPKIVTVTQLKTNKQIYILKSIYPSLISNLAYKIRQLRLPEPYKGKGVRYQGEYIKRKEGKKNAN
jgi:ribosomal protein L6P/L9E